MYIQKLTLFPLLLVLWTGCNKTSQPKPQLSAATDKISIEFTSGQPVPTGFKEIVTSVVTTYDKRYTLGFPVLTIVNEANSDLLPAKDGSTIVTFATGGPQEILINFSGTFPLGLTNVLIHELFHTIAPKERKPAPDGLMLGHDVCTGFHGLSLMMNVKDASGKEVAFRSIEEAAAEYCAYSLEH
ncbi:MAG: hypothetical protein Q7R93_04830, partial [bacterium]|nr:hypothetical protein [bacterium]